MVAMLKDLIEKEQKYINFFFEKLDLSQVERVVQALHDSKGIALFSGVGKSGFVAQKIAATMTSTGSRALYLSPTDALHGDIGFVTDSDLFVMLSKSGESDEMLNLIPFLRNRGVKIISMTSSAGSRMARASDLTITLPLEKELCPFDMAPTTSTIIQMIVGDLLVVSLMQRKELSLDQYANNHPAGQIGKRMTMKVKDLMLQKEQLPVCGPGDKLVEVLVELSNKQCGCIMVVDGAQALQGIFTDGDLRRALQNNGADALDLSMKELMVKSPRTIESEELVWIAMQTMESNQKSPITVLPVINREKLVGLIKMHDILQSGI